MDTLTLVIIGLTVVVPFAAMAWVRWWMFKQPAAHDADGKEEQPKG